MEMAVKWTDIVSALSTAAAAVGTIGTLIFLALQLKAQMRAIAEQREATRDSFEVLSRRVAIESAGASLRFNLDLTKRLTAALQGIAANEAVSARVWGNPAQEGYLAPSDSDQTTLWIRAVLDILAGALGAAEVMPGFEVHRLDWVQYVLDTFYSSDAIHDEAASDAGRVYWPEFAPILAARNAGIREARLVAL